MHASYAFLLDDLDLTGGTDGEEELVAAAVSMLEERYNHRLDENNWYQPEVLITKDGRVLQACPPGDWRERHEMAEHLQKEWKDKDVWVEAWNWATHVVALDMEIGGSSSFGLVQDEKIQEAATFVRARSREYLLECIDREVPERLSAMYKDDVGKVMNDGFDMQEYKRAKLARMYELSRSCNPSRRPFTWDEPTPYDHYRAIDLTHSGGDGDAVLLVDIHT